jgi:DnaJ-class molecular chaperone
MADLYKTLGVDRTATDKDIKKAYYRLAKLHHPDRVADPVQKAQHAERFTKISQAYETLIDPDKRRRYDVSGDIGAAAAGADINTAGASGASANVFRSMFRDMFDAHVFFGLPIMVEMPCTLEEISAGATKTVTVPVPVQDAVKTTETRTVQLQKHWRHGTKIRFAGPPQEIVVVLVELPNKTFRRCGADLVGRSTITLREALCGFEIRVKDLHDVGWTVRSTGVVSPASPVVKVPGAGMYRKDGTRGDILVEFTIQFPATLTETQRRALAQAL